MISGPYFRMWYLVSDGWRLDPAEMPDWLLDDSKARFVWMNEGDHFCSLEAFDGEEFLPILSDIPTQKVPDRFHYLFKEEGRYPQKDKEAVLSVLKKAKKPMLLREISKESGVPQGLLGGHCALALRSLQKEGLAKPLDPLHEETPLRWVFVAIGSQWEDETEEKLFDGG